MSDRLRIIVTGYIAQYPLGGVAWDYAQYPAGLAALGHDVYYIEDSGQWPYNPREGGTGKSGDFNADFLAGVMARFGLEDHWAYRFPYGPVWYGMSESRRLEVTRTADLFINVSGAHRCPSELGDDLRLVYIDSDPVFTQIKLNRGQRDFQALVDLHDVHFTFGENLPDAAAFETGHSWLPTRQPVLGEAWHTDIKPRPVLTTVMNWSSYKPIEFAGETFGQKDVEFMKILDLPRSSSLPDLEIAVAAGKTSAPPLDRLRHCGWYVVDPDIVCPDPDSYRTYIQRSLAEFSVAKNGYVAGRSGWFSTRSACYLAAGRPVVVQDTGLTGILPLGDGILVFDDSESAQSAISDLQARYEHHARAASEIAIECFDASKVLGSLVERAMQEQPSVAIDKTNG